MTGPTNFNRNPSPTPTPSPTPNQVRQVVVRHVAEAEAGAGGALSRFIMVSSKKQVVSSK